MNVYMFSYHTKILLTSSRNIESVLFFFSLSVTQVTSQPYSIQSISPAFKTCLKRPLQNKKVTWRCEHNPNNQFFYLTKRKKISMLWTTKTTILFFNPLQNDRNMLWGHNADNYCFNLSWNILHTIYILQLQQPGHRLKMEILMSQYTNETTQRWQLLFESYLKTFTHAICRLQREQPLCRFKAKPLISLRINETTQTTTFSIDNKNA